MYFGYLAGNTICPNCCKSKGQFMSAFTEDLKCMVRVDCPDCNLNMTHTKYFGSHPREEFHYHRRYWNWFGEMRDIIKKSEEALRLEDAGSTVHSEVLGAGNTLLLPYKPRKRRRSSLNANVMRRRARNRHGNKSKT